MVPARSLTRDWRLYAAAGVVGLAALLYPPAPSFGEAQRPQQKPPESHQADPGQNHETASAAPPIQLVQVYTAPQSREHSDQIKKESGDKSSSDQWMVRLTAILAFVGCVQVFIFVAQLFTSYSQLRAYVFLEDAKISAPIDGKDWDVIYIVRNSGATPAHNVKVVDVLSLEDWFPKQLPAPTEDDYFGSMAPGGDAIDSYATPLRLTPEQNTAVTNRDSKKAIFLVGKISYRDVFRRRHHTNFCFYWRGPIGLGQQQMTAYDEGNDST